MIKEIFFPEKTKTKRYIAQRIVGISIGETVVSAAQIHATATSTFVEKLYEEPVPPGAPSTYQERVSTLIKNILTQFSKFDQIRVSIPSSIVTFKELTLPFTDPEKIRMVLDYEVEPLLPFSLQEAVADFIITHQNIEQKTSQVLVAAVRQQDLQGFFDIYKLANIDPDCIVVDLFSVYGLYLQIPEYAQIADASVIIDIGSSTTSISFLLDGQIRLIRNISKGLQTIAEHIAQETSQPLPDVIQDLMTTGGQKNGAKYISSFLSDIQFTINSFSLKLNFYKEVHKILFVGKGALIKDLMELGKTQLNIPCEYFSCDKLFTTKSFKNKTNRLINNWTGYTVALGTAITYGPHEEFNLRKKDFAKIHFPLLNKQFVTAVGLILLIFAAIGIRGFMQVWNLKSIVAQHEQHAILKLKSIFPPRHAALKKTELKPLFRAAQSEVDSRTEAWAPFLHESLQPLEILLELTQIIDKRLFNISIEKITMALDEHSTPEVTVTGIFTSQPGKHFADFNNFVIFFGQQSKLLAIKDHDVAIADEGVKFTLKIKLKEKIL